MLPVRSRSLAASVLGITTSLVCLQERQKQLESLGISLQTSGIKVGDDKCFLVNLNADPALNELLVYYLKVNSVFTELEHSVRYGEPWSLSIAFNSSIGVEDSLGF